jgi:hypothetical protein
MERAIIPRLPVTHENYVVMSIKPLPEEELLFIHVRELALEFLIHHKRVLVRDVQRFHLGQALICLEHAFDHANLVLQSPHVLDGFIFRLVKHNEARNHRALEFNKEC